MGIRNREGALYFATGMDNTGLYTGRREAMGIIKAMTSEITSFDIFGGIGISAAAAFASAGKEAYQFEKAFQKSMLEVATISQEITNNLSGYQKSIIGLTQDVPVMADNAAKALYQIVSAGHDGAAGMKILEVSAKSAIGGVTETATAADTITTLINAYKMSADDAAKISDQLFTTVRLGKTTFGELGQSIAQVAPIAASYGVEMEQVLAAVATLTKSGTPTAQAMTQIRASIVGVSKVLGDGAFDGRTYQEALAEVAKRAGGSESKLRELVPEIEAVNGVLGLTGINAQAAAGDLLEMNNSVGATEVAFKKMSDGVEAQLQLLSNNITAITRLMGEEILKRVSDVANGLNEAFKNGDIESSLESLKTMVILVSGAFVAYKANVIGAAVATSAETVATNLLNNVKAAYNTVAGTGLMTKEKERASQMAYIASLEKTLTTEQRAKLSKMNLETGTKEYAGAITKLKEEEKAAIDKQVKALGKETAAAESSMLVTRKRRDAASAVVESRKQELAVLTSSVQAEKVATAQKELSGAMDKQRMARENAIALNRQKIAAQQAIIVAKENGQSAIKVAALEKEIRVINKKVVVAKAEYSLATQSVAAKQAEIASINRGVTSKEIETATKRLNTAVDKENTASTAANAAMKDFYSKKNATATASTKAGTIAVALNSAQQKANAAAATFSAGAHNILAAAKTKAALASEALATAIAANPLGALLTVISLAATAMMLFGKETEKTATALERINDAVNKQKENTDNLLNTLYDENEAERKRIEALEQLKKLYPDIYGNITLSNLADRDRNELLKQQNTLLDENRVKEIEAAMAAGQGRIKQLKDEHKPVTYTSTYGAAVTTGDNTKFIKDEEKKLKDLRDEYDKVLASKKALAYQKLTKDEKIAFRKKELEELDGQIKEVTDRIADANKTKLTFGGFSFPVFPSVDEMRLNALEEQQKKAKTEVADLEKPTPKSKDLIEKETEAAKKRRKAIDDINKTVLEVELKLQQEKNALLRDGRVKALEQIELERKQRIAAIDQEQKDLTEKYKEVGKKIPENEKKKFDERRTTANADADLKTKDTNKDADKELINRQKELTSVFLTEEEKRMLAIKDRYDKEREWAKKQLEGGNMTDKQYKDYVVQIDISENKDNLNGLLTELNDFKQQELTLTKEWDAKIATANSQKNAAIVSGDKEAEAVATDLVDRMTKAKGKALSSLNSQMLMQSSEWVRLFGNLDTLTVEELDRLIASIQSKIDEGSLNLNPVDLQILMDKLSSAKDRVAEINPFKALSGSMKEMKTAMAELKKAEADGLTGEELDQYKSKVKQAGEGAKKSIAAIAGAYGEVSDVMKSAADLIGMVDEGLGETVNNAIALGDAVMNVGEVVANAVIAFANGMSAMETASVILLVIKAVIMAVMAAISLFNGDKKHEKKIEGLQDKVDDLKRAYDKLGRSIEDAFSTNKAALIDKESENLKQQNELIRQQINEEREKKKTDNDKIKDWQNEIEDNNEKIEENSKKRRVEAIMGTEIQQAIDDFAQAYADAWASGDKAAGKSTDVVKKLIKTAIIDMLKNKLQPEVTAFMTFMSGAMTDGIIDTVEQQKIDEWEKKLEGIADETLKGKEKWLEDESKKKEGVTGKLQDALTEGTGSELVGLWHMTSLDIRALKEMSSEHFEDSKAYRLNVDGILEETRKIRENTERTANNTDGLIDELQEGFQELKSELGEIKNNTKSYNGRG